MEDVIIKKRADTASDRHLLVAKMELKLKKSWTTGWTISQKFNTTFPQDADKLSKFKLALSNKFQAFHDLLNGERTTMDSNWIGIKEAITSTCHEVLGHKKHHHKDWITVDTLDKIQERRNKKATISTSRTRAEKVKAHAEYTEVNKQMKSSIRTDKRKYVEDLATTAEKAAREGNMRQLYDTTKKLSGNRRKPGRSVKGKEGEGINNTEEQRNRKMICDVMPTINEDIGSQGDRDSLVSADGTNVEDMLLSMLDERDRLMEGLRESQEQVNETRTRLNEVERERDKLHAQLSAKMPQVCSLQQ
ncbi:unnamed protein product [Schistosoma margrebowiei]|uniref:Uncharacterized protein n=1 Tax=Schistosoma margrebowiei TaxID=48269 RepID=A0A183N2T2_9TREM|nr:unnamed protein product [Schistosoma margrebowiei]